ncbi:IspD/TarI family cytidylyltransferase [Erysipelothrix sp. strain 2 (EsS2-6-Brazil)]|uniref:2-C-methyl-D-erythritol 4-phosphate cytidylyltransferase n=1 Tax=Erysipelothrix rhusiopathiae TaxID=1648 RepID=A0A4P2VD97_ERYRH|nr:IspD/TarI family cytidylyltransferase [Erysipelothrix sp. strain 2 (EsS2-6-Brazil)]MBK2401982.1 2-C-methyl-D-erythritol 4-phosphate cytidylyltransferase [Erysipelothrix sp. strain 2 (EsS2-6-Brazil)]BBE36427.1 2-C-methyl-D-erythritol 4-phosphate cytidylyltransferase [Erysipelothrix rhusiopathiae]BBE36438.1 2-C-methyl-D-erythritol 4-phosphate cytidylyltransferase [Erysipelothrix rhusiopathiae]
MKNIALIFAGGTGSRMGNTEKPKQFLNIDDKPIIVHTLEKFNNCSAIDGIVVTILEEYIDYMKELVAEYSLDKVQWIVEGGETGQLSIFNGLDAVYKDDRTCENTVVLIHDGVRPIISENLILENIVTARTHGAAVTVAPATETVFKSEDKTKIMEVLKREDLFYARAPQTFFMIDIYNTHLKEMDLGITNNIDSCSMMYKYNHAMSFVLGNSSNIKITNYEDYFIFEALYNLNKKREEGQVLS